MRLSLVVPPLLAALAGAAACEPTYPGTPLGTYSVIESLEENSCGAGLPALATVELDVELRADGALGYWRLPRQAVIAGSYRASDGAFEFRSVRSVVAWPADLAAGVPGCIVEQRELVRGTVIPTSATDPPLDGAPSDAEVADLGVADADADVSDGGAQSDEDAGAREPPILLVGEHTVDVLVKPGSDCGALLVTNGGSFDALPCRARYTLAGVAAATRF